MAEVEVDVLAVARPADALLEEEAVRGDLEEVGSLGEVLGGVLLGAQLERDALRLEVLDLLLDREQGLVVFDQAVSSIRAFLLVLALA